MGKVARNNRWIENGNCRSGHRPLFKVRSNSSSLSRASPARRRVKRREKRAGYTKRWRVEAVFSAIKRMFGEKLSSRKLEYGVRELLIMVSLFNSFHSL